MIDKLKKKLEAASGMRAEISVCPVSRYSMYHRLLKAVKQDLQKQVKALTEENSEWETKYTALIRSRTTNAGPRATDADSVRF